LDDYRKWTDGKNGSSEIDEEEESKSPVKQQEGEDFLLCHKCIQLNRLTTQGKPEKQLPLHGEFADVLFNLKTIDDFLPGLIRGEWNSSPSLVGLSPHDFRNFASFDMSLFEHILFYRFWYKLMEQALSRKLSERMFRELLNRSQVYLMNNQALNVKINQ